VLAAVAWMAAACQRDTPGAASDVFDELRLPAGVTVLATDTGRDEAIYKIGSPVPLTEQAITFPPRFGLSMLSEWGPADCFSSRLSEPEPSPGCKARRVAVRYGLSPDQPEKRYCTLEVTQWSDVRTVGGRDLHLGVVGIHCNRPRSELGTEQDARLERPS